MFLERGIGPNSGRVGTYAVSLDFRFTIPAYELQDTYVGVLTLTVYD